MRKLFSLSLTACLLFTLVACGSTTQTETSTSTSTETSTKPTKPNGGGGGGLGGGSIDTSAITTKYTGVAYADTSATQTLDIYLPNEGTGPFPVIIAIHGGAFKMGSSTGGDVASMVEGVNRGYAVVSINYRLSGEAAFPAAVNDVRAAVRFLRANAETYQLDPDRFAAWGGSAGGNLAAMLGTAANVSELDGDVTTNLEYSSEVQAVVDWFGPLDFLKMDEQFAASGVTPVFGATSSDTSPESQYIGQNITIDPELTQQANPMSYIDTLTPENSPSFLIQHGTADGNVPLQQAVDFEAALSAQIGSDKVDFTILEGAGHGTSEFDAEENLTIVFDFLDSVLK